MIENALKFSGPGEPVALRATTKDDEVFLHVTDRGPDTGSRARARLRAVRRGRRRTGIVARGSASPSRAASSSLNGGRLWVEPASSGGSEFVLALPAVALARGGDRMSGARVLVVDDEPQILRALQLKLRGAGTRSTPRRRRARHGSRRRYDRPRQSSSTCSSRTGEERTSAGSCGAGASVPILVLSAVGEEQEKIAALDAGADDYVTKPFSGDELLARLRAALRRTRTSTQQPVVEVGDLRIDLERRHVTMGGEEVALTPIEYDLLRLLAENEGKLITHPTILREIWGPAYAEESNYLHVYVSHLRRKIEPDPARPRYILNQPGVGYRLVDPSGPF